MPVKEVVEAISTLGFPIVMCGALIFALVKMFSLHREEMHEVNDNMNKNNDKAVEALNNNTLALTSLLENLRKEVRSDENRN